MTGSQLFCINRDVCHMWVRKFALFPEHLISLPLGRSRGYPFIIKLYTLQNWSVLGLCLRINESGLFAWISLTALSRTITAARQDGPSQHNKEP